MILPNIFKRVKKNEIKTTLVNALLSSIYQMFSGHVALFTFRELDGNFPPTLLHMHYLQIHKLCSSTYIFIIYVYIFTLICMFRLLILPIS